ATLSYNVLTNLLRKELGYTGIIITDCMEMKAIADGFGTSEGAIMSIKAGSDIVLVSHSINKQKQAIVSLCPPRSHNNVFTNRST
ncbi:unnamed protein product, partial [marine sediment metagenome]